MNDLKAFLKNAKKIDSTTITHLKKTTISNEWAGVLKERLNLYNGLCQELDSIIEKILCPFCRATIRKAVEKKKRGKP